MQFLKQERHYAILARLRRDGRVLAQELSRELQVSEDTIRRDLRELARAGKLQRVHGGALLRSPATGSQAERAAQAVEAKTELARAAVRLLEDGQVILLDGGTTNLEVARHLPRTLSATVVTPSPAIASALLEHPLLEVVVLGGKLLKRAAISAGIAAAEALRLIRADVCLLGVCSLHPQHGISVVDYEEAQLKRLMIAQSADLVALAVADKLDTALPHIVAPLAALTHLVTERSVPDQLLDPYRGHGLTIIQV